MTREENIIEAKALRVALDLLNQRVQVLPSTRATSITKTKIDEATMWLGQNLKELDTPNPYPNSRDNTTVIAKTADGLKF